MKSLLAAITATLLLLTIWAVFLVYAGTSIDSLLGEIDTAAEYFDGEDWDSGQKSVDRIFEKWFQHRLFFSLFFDAVSIVNVESTLIKADAYGKAKEKGSAIAELASLKHLLAFLYENERISIENIF